MSLPWVRLDAGIANHDKTIAAVSMRGGKAAMSVYMFALAWSGAHGTDGHIPRAALRMLHGTKQDAYVLQSVGLWEVNGDGWNIHNYARRQELALVTEVKRRSRRLAAIRTNCVRWHGADCNCWMATDDTSP